MKPIIEVKDLSKKYDLGKIGSGTVLRDFDRWVSKFRGKADPNSTINQTKQSDVFWALKNISFEVNQGDTVGIIGRNGAGKSTLLKILSRITTQSSGSFSLGGRLASLLEVGTGFHPDLTGRENIFMNGAILGMSRKEIIQKLDNIIEFSGIQEHIDTPVKRYSSGMYVRLAFSVAAHLEQEILIVDEVLAVGDADFQKRCLGKMDEVSKNEGRTVLFVSHSMGAIGSLCKKGILLSQGQLIDQGDVQNVILKYVHGNPNLRAGEYLFDHKANQEVSLTAIRVYSNKVMLSDLAIDSEIEIEIEFNVYTNKSVVVPSVTVLDYLGTPVVASPMLSSAILNKEPLSTEFLAGKHIVSCKFPPNFFNDGSYQIDVALAKPELTDWYDYSTDGALKFNIIDTGIMRKEYTGKWLGVVRPKLLWNIAGV
jgi:lipopolysaccharide transport system ATP-binding protein